MTISEKLFEKFCSENNIEFSRISPDGIKKTPDYEISLGKKPVIVEVKELTLNNDEKQALHNFEKKNGCSWNLSKIGNRIRYKINDAKKQLKRLAFGKYSGILLLFDARPFPIEGISAYEVEVAMYGCESIDLHVSENMAEPVRFGKHRFGKGKKFRPDCHNYISAIGVLKETDIGNQLHLDLYRNIFADIPLSIANLIGQRNITVFTVAPGNGNEFRGWVQVTTDEK